MAARKTRTRRSPNKAKALDAGSLRCFQAALAVHLFQKIHAAFLVKEDGRADDTGLKWKPLDKRTIAYRPLQPGDRKRLGTLGLGASGRGLLTASQLRQWRGIFASQYKKLLHKVGEAEAKRLAAKMAWAIMKSKGARTKLEAYGNRKVPILKVSGRLEQSLAPGVISGDEYVPSPEQVFRREGDNIVIGTSVPYAEKLHKKRPLWPKLSAMARAGWLRSAVSEALKMVSHR